MKPASTQHAVGPSAHMGAPSASRSSATTTSSAAWLEDVYSKVARGDVDAALDVLMQNFDDLFHANQFKQANSLLRHVDLQRLDVDTMVGLLAATLPARQELSQRERIVERVRSRLERQVPERLDGLLRGLD